MPVEKAVEYAGQILDALDAAHRKGFTHRDLKPNIPSPNKAHSGSLREVPAFRSAKSWLRFGSLICLPPLFVIQRSHKRG